MPDSAVYVSRVGINTLNKVTVPLIFVPGVMGSRLHFPKMGMQWDPDEKIYMITHWMMLSADRERMVLDWSNPAQVMTEAPKGRLKDNEAGRGWEGISWDSYGEFLRYLDSYPFAPFETPVYAIGYDWRQSNKDSAVQISSKIEEILKRENSQYCIIFTHSMGGIATRAALKITKGLIDKVMGVIHVVQPVAGAAVAYNRFLTGANYNPEHFWDLKKRIGTYVFNTILGDTPGKYAKIQSGLRGPTELLPTKHYHDEGGNPWLTYNTGTNVSTGNIYDVYRTPHSPPGLVDHFRTPDGAAHTAKAKMIQDQLMQRVTEAEKFHDWLDLFKHDETWTIYGTGKETDMAVIIDPVDGKVKPQRREQGDGTVPQTSGQELYPGQANAGECFEWIEEKEKRHFYVTGVEHSEAFKDGGVNELVQDAIRQILG